MRAGPQRGADERVEFIKEAAEAEVIVVFSSAAASQSSTTLSSSAVLWLKEAIALCLMMRSNPLQLLRSTEERDESSDIDTGVLNMLDARRLIFTPSLKPLLDDDVASEMSRSGVAPRFAARFAPPFPATSRAECDATLFPWLESWDDEGSDGRDCLDALQPIADLVRQETRCMSAIYCRAAATLPKRPMRTS